MRYWTIVGYKEKNKTGIKHIYGTKEDCLKDCEKLQKHGWFEIEYSAGIIDESYVDDWYRFIGRKGE